MKYLFTTALLSFILSFFMLDRLQAKDILFNKDWKFYKGNAATASRADFDDDEWRKLDLPHDWAIEGPFDEQYNARAGGLPFHGTGWYRKHFSMPEASKGKAVRLEFEGAMYNAHVWVNGELVGNRPFGYIGFEFDISKYLKYDGSDNVIAVRLSPEDLSSRWYPGAGIYRSVWLKVDEKIHVGQWGTYITTPTVTDKKAVVQHETVIQNDSGDPAEVVVKQTYFDPSGNQVGEVSEEVTIAANSSGSSAVYADIPSPERWDLATPHLYKAITTVLDKNGRVMDEYSTAFGIRTIKFDKDAFYLNGRKVRFNGVCLHHDNGALGAAVYRRADERKLQIMKSMGVNAIRTSHNPPSRELLELCDEMGLLVLDEAFDVWKMEKVANGYNKFFDEWGATDMRDMILRDRNHPSVIMWSIGNEIIEQRDAKNGWKVAKMLHEVCAETDPTRPSTIGLNYYPAPYDHNLAQQVDITGINYKPSKYSEIRGNYPQLPIYGSETSSVTSSRGVYHLPIKKYTTHDSKQVTSYDLIGPPWAYPPDIEFHFQEQNPYVMGEFMWTGFDYLGEPTPYGGKDNSTNGYWNDDWPARSSYFGAVDLCGFPKDRFYLYQSQWTEEPMIHLLPHWNWEGMEDETIPVYCYTNCDEAELFLNGESLGKKVKGKDKTPIIVDFLRYEPKTFASPYRLSWDVPYQAGELKVVGYKEGKAIQEKTINTAGKPASISLNVDRTEIDADGRDLAYVTVKVTDKDGNTCPIADNLVEFEVKGEGELIAVDNGDPTSVSPFQADYRKAFNGMCLAIIRATEKPGNIELTATSKSLKKAQVTISTKPQSSK
ncbi:glycoside hydrolase family 2 [Echinicola strongylocentroti]|uniref:Glycoside hydrolase family 2 n=1 Tax=Echinicola strongylocentroti TaxID=1795355 RepID=A0A2Z4IES0_9BACT|nr:beta-galactosidase GalB [Echinicola strongylocentroti]AWW29582.1 glycoside hydrolase family 2 [Echinicola strongylocentroti]